VIQVTLICDGGHRTDSLTEEASELGFATQQLQVQGDAHTIDEDDALIGKRK
jgi:hypothetical protein